MGWLQKLKQGLSKSSQKVSDSLKSLTSLSSLMGASKLDAASIEEVEDALIGADLGTKSAARLAEAMRKHKFDGPVTSDSLAAALADSIAEILRPVATPLVLDSGHRPHVLLLVGVNGSGKTTTAGKLAQQWHQQGKTVLLAAGDTFRAAAIEQLQIWGDRTGTKVIAGDQGSDAAALAYAALETAQKEQADILIIDTAGRLQNRTELMDELAKIVRVIRKLDESAPHDSVIVLDGTVGQNALSQVKAFQQAADVSGLIVTKLDGSAKGGVVVALAEEFGLPVHAVGVGEAADDLQPFDAQEFANALTGVTDRQD
jgi:fused signal recognition particle receptor